MTLLGLLVWLIVAGTIIWAARKLLAAFGIGDPIATVVWVILVVLLLLAFLSQVGLSPNLGVRLR